MVRPVAGYNSSLRALLETHLAINPLVSQGLLCSARNVQAFGAHGLQRNGQHQRGVLESQARRSLQDAVPRRSGYLRWHGALAAVSIRRAERV